MGELLTNSVGASYSSVRSVWPLLNPISTDIVYLLFRGGLYSRLDRLLQHGIVVTVNGPSYRMRRHQERLETLRAGLQASKPPTITRGGRSLARRAPLSASDRADPDRNRAEPPLSALHDGPRAPKSRRTSTRSDALGATTGWGIRVSRSGELRRALTPFGSLVASCVLD